MDSVFHRPLSAEVTPSKFSAGGPVAHDLFDIGMRYRPEGNIQWFLLVHIPKSLQPLLLDGDIKGLHMETLSVNCVASRLLPGAPKYVILAVTTAGGERVGTVPAAFVKARWVRLGLGGAACLCGAALVFSPYAWAGAIALVLGSHGIRTARGIPAKPFRVYAEHC